MIAGYVGTDPVEKIYLGTELVWSAEPPIDYTQQYLTHEYVSGNGISHSEAGLVTYTKVYMLEDENLRQELWGNPNRYVPDGLTTSEAQALSPTTNRRTMLNGNSPDGCLTFWSCDENNVSMVQSGWSYKVYGNILSLYYGDNFSGQTEFPAGASSLRNLFANLYGNFPNDSRNMFCIDASNLILTPRHLTAGCYEGLFYGQTSVSAVTCLATDISATDCTKNWLAGVSPTGVFYKHPNMTVGEPGGWTRGDSGIPTGWTVKDYPLPLPDVS